MQILDPKVIDEIREFCDKCERSIDIAIDAFYKIHMIWIKHKKSYSIVKKAKVSTRCAKCYKEHLDNKDYNKNKYVRQYATFRNNIKEN